MKFVTISLAASFGAAAWELHGGNERPLEIRASRRLSLAALLILFGGIAVHGR
jgi:hypothetical protein